MSGRGRGRGGRGGRGGGPIGGTRRVLVASPQGGRGGGRGRGLAGAGLPAPRSLNERFSILAQQPVVKRRQETVVRTTNARAQQLAVRRGIPAVQSQKTKRVTVPVPVRRGGRPAPAAGRIAGGRGRGRGATVVARTAGGRGKGATLSLPNCYHSNTRSERQCRIRVMALSQCTNGIFFALKLEEMGLKITSKYEWNTRR